MKFLVFLFSSLNDIESDAHGEVNNLKKNQTVVGLVGGVESVIMSDKSMGPSDQKVQRRLKYQTSF
jgi:hypothetical protein